MDAHTLDEAFKTLAVGLGELTAMVYVYHPSEELIHSLARLNNSHAKLEEAPDWRKKRTIVRLVFEHNYAPSLRVKYQSDWRSSGAGKE